ncbi:MAG: hypothetical protein HFF50_09245 [Lawsonibacter sp.]|nr:hypothetical protein [Lawsonibacter sp.]
MKKKLVLFTAALTLSVCLTACGGPSAGPDGSVSAASTPEENSAMSAIGGADGPAVILTAPQPEDGSSSAPQAPDVSGDSSVSMPDPAAGNNSGEPPESPAVQPPAAVTKPEPQPAERPQPIQDPEPPKDSQPAQEPDTSQEPQPPEDPEPSQEPEPAAPTREAAAAYIGRSAASMIAAIGAPNGSSYAPSCMGEGEDGELFYSSFTVYTYREGGSEIVQDVL